MWHILILVFAGQFLAGCQSTSESPDFQIGPTERAKITSNVRSGLESQGYTVQQGKFEFFLIEDCQFLDNCYGNNPSSPYGLFYTDFFPGDATGAGDIIQGLTRENSAPSLRMQPGDAVVFIGQTPPPAKYFGLTPYVLARKDVDAYADIFASLTDTLNNYTIQTAQLDDQGSVFNEETVIIVTADLTTDKATRKRLQDAGVPQSIINTIYLPADLINFGTDENADVLMLLFRVAFFEDATLGQRYVDDPPVTITHIRANPDVFDFIPAEPLPLVPYVDSDQEAELKSSLNDLERMIIEKYSDYNFSKSAPFLLPIEGHSCIKNMIFCLGDNRDTPYIVNTGAPLPTSTTNFSVAYGVNHVASGTAKYSNIAFYNPEKLMGVAGAGNDDYFGSAHAFIPGHHDADKLFAVVYARNCDGFEELCIEIPIAFPGIPEYSNVSVVERAYNHPQHLIGVPGEDILGVRTLHFSLD